MMIRELQKLLLQTSLNGTLPAELKYAGTAGHSDRHRQLIAVLLGPGCTK